MIDKNQILETIKKNSLCILSTVSSDNKSESAVMAYSIKDDFTFIMSTEPNTRKYSNILSHSSVSIIVGGVDSPSIQIDATAKIVDGEIANGLKDFALAQHPELKDYLSDTVKFIEIKTNWLRYTDFSKNPPEIVEFGDF